jgi:hypothetical protein
MNSPQASSVPTEMPRHQSPALPPARQMLVKKMELIASLKGQLPLREKRLEDLRAKYQVILDTTAEFNRATETWRALRAAELRGERIDTVEMQRVSRRRSDLVNEVHAKADEGAALADAITALQAENTEINAEVAKHESQVLWLVREAGREYSLIKIVQEGRLKKLVEDFRAGLADIFAGAVVGDLLRRKFPQLKFPPSVEVTIGRDPDEIRVPRLLDCLPFNAALNGSSVNVDEEMLRQRAEELLAELLPQ